MKTIKKGNKVKVEYVGMLEDKTIFDSSEKYGQPLEFEVGAGQIIKGFESAVIGMKQGEEKEIKLKPKDAYGEYDPNRLREMPRERFPSDQEILPGMVFMMTLQDGRQMPVKISKVSADTITIDLNPPLAGKTLIFKIKVVEITN